MSHPSSVSTRSIFDLPIEIIQGIMSLLYPCDAVSFSISSRRLLGVVGTCHIKNLSRNYIPWYRVFLQTLERDIPYSIFCWTCIKLHNYPRLIDVKELFDRVSCSRCTLVDITCPPGIGETLDYNKGVKEVYHADFYFEHVAMTMKLHRSGDLSKVGEYLKLLTLDRPHIQLLSPQPEVYGLYFFEPRIVNGLMVIRTQTWSRASCYHFPTQKQEVRPCSHFASWLYSRDEVNLRYSDLNPPDGYFLNRVPWPQRNDLQYMPITRCNLCKTELSFHRRQFSKGDVNFFATCMTKWQILGRGTSPMLDWSRPWLPCNSFSPLEGDYTELGSIACLFESQSGVEYDSNTFDDWIWEELHSEDDQRRIKKTER